jgi:hypothetical protein
MDCRWATVDARQMEVCLSILPVVVGLSLTQGKPQERPAIGGKGQFLKASCHRGGLVKAALKGILWDSAAINSRGSETPTGPWK